jgi:uncharacterized repeat protein (TIGR01451 family)
MFTFTVRRWFTSLFVLLGLIGGALPASAQVVYTLNGPAQASFCDTLVLTSRFQNSGGTLAGLVITQQLPHGSFVYVPSNSVVTLPDGSVLTNAAAEPTVLSGGQTLVWDFSSLVTSSTLTRPLITEVFYDPTNTLEDAYEWIELYNPTLGPIGLTNWSIRDAAPGQIDTLPTFTMAPGQFVIIAATTNAFYEQFPGYTGAVYQVADGKLGSGLNNFADGLTLRDQVAANVDAVSYGGSTAAFNPPVSLVSDGQSIQRNPANVDSNTRSDWQALATPGPGAGSIQSGIGAGGVVQIVYQVEVACGSPAGQFVGSASFQQPPSAPASTVQALRFVTVNDGDLTVTKTPSVTDAGVGDPISWLVTVKNEGFGNAPNVRISDTLGVGLAFTGFSVAPTNAGPYGSSVAWDATVIPALTNLTAGQAVTVRVDAVVVSCSNLFNSADANWGCPPMKAVTNTACENTALLGETAGAAIHFLDRYPAVSARLLPASPISIDYCSGSPLTLVVSNASGAAVGIASVTRFTPTLPAGWSISGGSVVSGQVVVGTLAPGQSSNVTFTLTPGGACPLATSPQLLGLLGAFVDPCGNIFAGPALYTQVQIGNRPGATVSKQMPTSVNATSGIIPVAIFYAYSNLTATTVTFSDAYPVSPNLSPVSISGGGVLNTSLHTITWTDTLTGSGVVTQTFNLAIGTVCGGPNGQFFNTILAPNFVDCRGCTVSVGGNGRVYPTSLNTGTNCPGGGGTGGCFVATSKSAPTAMQEICEPVVVTQRFSAFNGTSLQTNWNGVLFTSDLAGGQGRLTSTSSVQVFIGASNVTPYVSIVTTSPALTLALSNLNDSIFAQPTNVIGTMEVRWGLTVTNAGQVGGQFVSGHHALRAARADRVLGCGRERAGHRPLSPVHRQRLRHPRGSH